MSFDVLGNFSIDEFRAGAQPAFAQVFKSYYSILFLFCKNIVKHKHQAEDIVVDTFVKLWQRHAQFESERNIKFFLYVTARNACIDYLRRLQTHQKLTKEMEYFLTNEHAVENEMINAEVIPRLHRAIDDLPNRTGLVFKLYYFKHLKTTEIASQLGMKKQSVLNQKAAAIRALIAALFGKNGAPRP